MQIMKKIINMQMMNMKVRWNKMDTTIYILKFLDDNECGDWYFNDKELAEKWVEYFQKQGDNVLLTADWITIDSPEQNEWIF